jgi:hypothetical protein
MEDGSEKKIILQRMNKNVFPRPVELMENVLGVTSYLKKIIIEQGGDPERETLNVIPAADGKAYYLDSEGEYWRAYKFITDAVCLQAVEKPEDFYEVLYLLVISRDFLLIIQQKRFMKQL